MLELHCDHGKVSLNTEIFKAIVYPENCHIYDAIEIHEPDWTSLDDPSFQKQIRIWMPTTVLYNIEGKAKKDL